MKRLSFTFCLLLAAGAAIFAQEAAEAETASTRPTSEQTKAAAGQYLEQVKTSSSDFDTMQNELNVRNTSNKDTTQYNLLKAEIDKLESGIRSEQNKTAASLEKGLKISQEALDRIQKMIDQHKTKMAELESFTTK